MVITHCIPIIKLLPILPKQIAYLNITDDHTYLFTSVISIDLSTTKSLQYEDQVQQFSSMKMV